MKICLDIQMAQKKETVSWLKISIVIWFFSIMLIIITSLVKLNNICCCLRDFYSTLLLP